MVSEAGGGVARDVDVRVLGPVEVDTRGVRRALRPQLRKLVAMLAVTPGATVTIDALVDGLWDDGVRPRDPAATLFTHVARLRAALGDREHVLVRLEGAGYRLEVDWSETDSGRFETALASGRARARIGDQEGAQGTLAGALSEWRGPAFEDFATAPFAYAEAARLEDLRAAAAETLGEVLLTCGQPSEAAELARQFVAMNPFRESMWFLFLRALLAHGRVAEARMQFTELCNILKGELGLPPSAQIVQLFDVSGWPPASIGNRPATSWQGPASTFESGPGGTGSGGGKPWCGDGSSSS